MNWFGRSHASPPRPAAPVSASNGTGVNGALAELKRTVDNMNKRQEFLEKKILVEQKKALELKNKGNRNGALMCLKRKKMLEKEVTKLVNAAFNLEQQAIALESSQTTVDVVESQKEYKVAMQKISKQVNVDDVSDLQDEIQEQMTLHEEISDVLAQNNALDDSQDLENELEELMNEEEEEDVLTVDLNASTVGKRVSSTVSSEDLPSVPQGSIRPVEVKTQMDDDEAALRELEAELAG